MGSGTGSSAGRVARYSCWCPKAIAAIGHLHPTLASRCIVIRMHRKTAGEECERLKRLNATELQRKCARFVMDHAAEIASAEPQIPEGLTNRAADIWEPLLALADLAGGRWPELAREAASGLTARAQEHSPIGSLLMDIFLVFLVTQSERIFSRELVGALVGSEERPWTELRKGKPVTEMWLAQQLRPYGIKPRTIRMGEQLAKGYVKEDFMDTFRRYIPKSEVESVRRDLAERTVRKTGKQGEAGDVNTGGGAVAE
jgi:putative DNA primase/helicase